MRCVFFSVFFLISGFAASQAQTPEPYSACVGTMIEKLASKAKTTSSLELAHAAISGCENVLEARSAEVKGKIVQSLSSKQTDTTFASGMIEIYMQSWRRERREVEINSATLQFLNRVEQK
jgi:hypothetical protein